MNIKNKIVRALGGVPGEKYKMMKTLYDCEKIENRRLRERLDSVIEVASTVTVDPITRIGRNGDKEFEEYIEHKLAYGLASGMKEHMMVMGITERDGTVKYTASVFVIGKEEQDDG